MGLKHGIDLKHGTESWDRIGWEPRPEGQGLGEADGVREGEEERGRERDRVRGWELGAGEEAEARQKNRPPSGAASPGGLAITTHPH